MSNVGMTALGICLIFIATSLGAAMVFFFKKDITPKVNSVILGFASGIMISASIWCLMLPAINQSESYGKLSFLPVSIGFILGGTLLFAIDKIVERMNGKKTKNLPCEGTELTEDLQKKFRPTKLFLAVTIHNIPEGLAVGVAFGTAYQLGTTEAFVSALGLAIGIAIQNFPEGMAISLPMKQETGSIGKSFLYGVGSGAVEPVFAVFGLLLTTFVESLLPWILSFAAGAMVFVIIEELIPECKLKEHPHLGAWGFMVGFVIMMALDIVFG